MEEATRKKQHTDTSLANFSYGKDELNLAEFPLSSLAGRVDSSQKTVVFGDKMWDRSKGEMIARRLTITASDEHGLPTALDDEVILGFIQLSKLQNFEDPSVNFSRYQLIKLLGWRDDGRSYERIEKALKRWVGVTLYYQNAWWSKAEKCWVDEAFHIIETFTLYDQENSRRKKTQEQQNLPLSNFTWGKAIFKSFRSGNLKSLDFDFFKKLRSPITKRIYRFLDKRFWRKQLCDFDLKEFAWEHIGLSRNYDASNLKRKLFPAICELEEAGFLKLMKKDERFVKVGIGEWRIIFKKAFPTQIKRLIDGDLERLKNGLIERGVTPSIAQELVERHSESVIEEKLEVFDWMVEQNDKRVSQNPAGYLVSSIKTDYNSPQGFVPKEVRREREKVKRDRKKKSEEERLRLEAEKALKEEAQQQSIEEYWTALSAAERSERERDAIMAANEFQKKYLSEDSSVGRAVRQGLLDEYALIQLERKI